VNERELREQLAAHVEAVGFPLAADVIRRGDELPEYDLDAVYVPATKAGATAATPRAALTSSEAEAYSDDARDRRGAH
jgi:hypothetical protein